MTKKGQKIKTVLPQRQLRNYPFCVRPSPVHNKGVFSLEKLEKNALVGIYKGKIYSYTTKLVFNANNQSR